MEQQSSMLFNFYIWWSTSLHQQPNKQKASLARSLTLTKDAEHAEKTFTLVGFDLNFWSWLFFLCVSARESFAFDCG